MRIAYCGFGRAAKECLFQLLTSFNISLEDIFIYTHNSEQNHDFIETLHNLNISYTFDNINNDFNHLTEFKPDFLLSVYYRYIIKNNILAIVENKAMNLHPALLPDYKGCFSSVWALINGEKETGITFHYITDTIDGGNILLQKKITIGLIDTAYLLYNKLISLFVVNFPSAFKLLLENSTGTKQPQGESYKYYSRKLPFDGILKARDITFIEADRFVRAMYFPPFKPAKFIMSNGEIEIESTLTLKKYANEFKKQ